MPSFANPFSGNVHKKISKTELLQALRIDIASELEAIYLYDAHAHATDDALAKKVLMDIRDEEVAHVGEQFTLMKHLDSSVADLLLSGEDKVKEMMEELDIIEPGAGGSVGSLIEN